MPDTETLTEEQLKEIEARVDAFPLSPFQARALCRSLRAAWARLESLNNLGEEMLSRLETVTGIGKKADHGWYFVVEEVERQITALRTQNETQPTPGSSVSQLSSGTKQATATGVMLVFRGSNRLLPTTTT